MFLNDLFHRSVIIFQVFLLQLIGIFMKGDFKYEIFSSFQMGFNFRWFHCKKLANLYRLSIPETFSSNSGALSQVNDWHIVSVAFMFSMIFIQVIIFQILQVRLQNYGASCFYIFDTFWIGNIMLLDNQCSCAILKSWVLN